MKEGLKKAKKPVKLLKTKKKKVEPGKLKMQDMSVDDFLHEFVSCEGKTNSKKKKVREKAEKLEEFELQSNEDSEQEESENDIYVSHKKQLSALQKSDPEFYKYLQENDQELLNFDDSDLDSDGEKSEKFHKPSGDLEIASDESDYEPDEEVKQASVGRSNKITTEMITQWQSQLMSKNNFKTLREVVEAFHAALVSVSPEDDQTAAYKVEGATVFNSIIRMCVIDFLPGVQKALKIEAGSKVHPEKCKNWSKIKHVLKSYFVDLAELCGISSTSMLTVLLKHVHQMCSFIACFPAVAPKFLKRVIQLWATDDDVIRVLAFLCALRLSNLRPSLLKQGLKLMHMTYVRNTRFVSPNSLPGINFMRQSLCEMFALDTTVTYHMAFLYIRELAVHLRNAITLKKKEAYKTVYNWAYISSLHLWADLFSIVSTDSPLKSLVYPLVQIIIGSIKLIPSSQYFPLRFHCVRILINLSNKTGIFIPILPFLLEVLHDFNFNQEHKKLSMKPMDLTCILRCSKSQMKENAFKDALIENVHDLCMEYLMGECHRVSFPDITVLFVLQVKQFLKTCKVVNYTKKMKAVLDKVYENSKFIEAERKKSNLSLEDINGVEAIEIALRMKEPPFLKYYNSWKKIHLQQQARKITNNQKLGDFKLPVLYKMDKKRNRIDTKSVGPPELFPSDDEDSDRNEILCENLPENLPKKKRKKETKEEKVTEMKEKRQKRNIEKEQEDDYNGESDILQDLSYADL